MISEKIRNLNPVELRVITEKIAIHKRKIEALFIEHLAEIVRRRVFVDWGFTSAYDYLTTELKFSGSAAYRRLQAAQILLQIPEIKNDIETGALNLSQICSAQVALKQEQKTNGPVGVEEKLQLFSEIRHKTARETEKIIDQKYESTALAHPIEKHKHDETVELQLRLPKDLYEQLMRVKELYSHKIPDGGWIELLRQMSHDVIQKRDPLKKAVRTNTKRFVFQRDQVCQHKRPDGSLCASRYQLEVDHIQPRFAGGGDQLDNLRILCRVHNQSRYRQGRS